MRRITVGNFSFGSFAKLCAAILFAAGIAFAIFLFICSLLGANVYLGLNGNRITGVPAGALSLIVVPLVGAIIGFLSSFVLVLPFKILLRFLGGISLNVRIIDQPTPPQAARQTQPDAI